MFTRRQESNQHGKGACKTRTRSVPGTDARAWVCALEADAKGVCMNEVVTLSRGVEINDIRPLICELRGQAETKELIANCDRFKMRKHSSSRRCGVWGAMRQVHEDRLRNLPRPLHHRRPEGNLLDGRIAKGRGATDLRRRENGRGGHSGASRVDPQGDGGSARIRQGPEGLCVERVQRQ